MSLKGFHIVFIVASIAISFGFGAWALTLGGAQGDPVVLWLGRLSVVAGVALVGYGIWFVRKIVRGPS